MHKVFNHTLLLTNNKDQSLKKIISRVAILATSSMVIMGSMDAMATDLNINAQAFIPNNAAPIMATDLNISAQAFIPNNAAPIMATDLNINAQAFIPNNRGVSVQEIMARNAIALNNRTLALNHRLGMFNDDDIHRAIQQVQQQEVRNYLQGFLDNRLLNNQNAIFAPEQNNNQALQRIMEQIIQMSEDQQRDFRELIANQEITVENLEAILDQRLVRANQGAMANVEEVLNHEDVDGVGGLFNRALNEDLENVIGVEGLFGSDDESEDNQGQEDNRVFTQNNHVLENTQYSQATYDSNYGDSFINTNNATPTPEQEIEELLFLRESTDSGNPDNLDDSSNRTSQSVNQRQEYSKDTLRIVDAMDNASDFSSLEGVADMFDEEKTLSFQNAHKVEIEASLDDESIEEASVADKKKLYLSTIVSTDKETQKKESAKRDLLVKSSPKVSKAFISQAFATTRKRQNNINMGIAAIAAGDDGFNIAKGLWVSGLYGVSNQDSVKDASGYKGKIAGGSVGGDIDINDDTMIGVSYSRLLSGVKFKDNLSGNKLDINSNIVSLYGRQNITDKFYINGMVSFGKSQINNKRSLEVAGLSKTAKSKTNNTSYNAELDVSYNLTGKQMIVIPSVGLRYSYYTNGSYKESGAGVHNLEFDKSSYSDGAFVAGTKMLMPKRLSGDTKIAPSISLSVEKEIRTKKQPTVRTKLSWMDKYIESEPSLKGTTDASGNIGLGMLIEHKNLEMNAQYNLHFKERYKAHQGSLQLKINF